MVYYKQKFIFLFLVFLFLSNCLAKIKKGSENLSNYETISIEMLINKPNLYNKKKIIICDSLKLSSSIVQTIIGCPPDRPCCNQAIRYLTFRNKIKIINSSKKNVYKSTDQNWGCSGDECAQNNCTPFNKHDIGKKRCYYGIFKENGIFSSFEIDGYYE